MTSSSTRRGRALTAVVLLVGLGITAGASIAFAEDLRGDRDRRFDRAAERARASVGTRILQNVQNVTQLRDWLMISGGITRQQFHDHAALGFAQGLYPGVQAVSFARAIDRRNVASFEESVRADLGASWPGGEPFSVHPQGNDPQLYVVEYIEPLEGNEPALGLDLATDPERRAAVEGARDRGDPVGTPPVRLVQLLGEPGFILNAAVYDATEIPQTPPARRRHFVGVVGIVFRFAEIFEGTLGPDPEVDVEVYDLGPTVDAPSSRFDDTNRLFDSEPASMATTDGELDGIHRHLDLNIGDRRWRMLLTPGPGFDGTIGFLPATVALLGAAVSFLLAGVIDTTNRARSRAERLAEDMTAELRTAEDRSRSIVDGAPDATVVVAADGRIVLANHAAEALFGHPADELIGQPIEVLLPDDLRAAHRAHRAHYLEEPRRREMGADLELLGRRRDGTTFPLEVSLSPLAGPGGTTEVIAAARDITERRKAEAALQLAYDHERAAAEQLRHANEQKSAFLRTISHELRTPLTAISGFTSVLLNESVSEEQRADYLRRVLRNAEGLGSLITEALAFARLERHEVVLQPTLVDVGDEARMIVEQLGPVLDGHRVTLHVSGRAVATLDRDALTRILTNLLTNAARYAPAGSAVTVEVAGTDRDVRITVTDEGPGIPGADRERVFDRFYRGSAALTAGVPGTGIGLAVVKELAELSGGATHVEDSPTGGARLVVVLPATAVDAVPDPLVAPTGTVDGDVVPDPDRR